MTSGLSPKTQRLLERARLAEAPSGEDRARVRAKLLERSGHPSSFIARWGAFTLCAALIVGGGMLLRTSGAAERPPEESSTTPLDSTPLDSTPLDSTPAALRAVGVLPTTKPVVQKSSATCSLAQELSWLERAKTDLEQHRADQALHSLALHARRCAKSAMSEERELLRVLALCELGKTREAEQAVRVFRFSPERSVHWERLQQSCAVGALEAEAAR